jgi:Kef-type K+ transport system membrane component KefB
VDNVWLVSALWLGLALGASVISIWVGISVALIEMMVGAVAGNTVGLTLAPWVNYLAGFGAILLTFLAGAEIDAKVVRKNLWSSFTIGVMGFFAPYLGVLLFARCLGRKPRLPGFRCRPPRSPSSTRSWSRPG